MYVTMWELDGGAAGAAEGGFLMIRVRLMVVACLALGLVLALGGTASAAKAPAPVLSGTVYAHDTGLPLAGASVDVYTTRTKGATTYYTYIGMTTTDANGVYSVPGAKAGQFISVDCVGYVGQTSVIPYIDRPYNVSLYKAASISGSIVLSGGADLYRAQLYKQNPDGSWAIAADGGTVTADYPAWTAYSLEPGVYKIAYMNFRTQSIVGWHEGASTLEAATPITVAEGQVITGITAAF